MARDEMLMRISLTEGAYTARAASVSAQDQVNLYSEKNPESAPFPITLYPTPGLTVFAQDTGNVDVGRCVYTASNGMLFCVIGGTVYSVTDGGAMTRLGYIHAGTNPVSMADNGITVIIGDGTSLGWQFDLSTQSNFTSIIDPAFYGFTRADFVDTFFILNRPGTAQFYVSPSEYVTDGSTPFDSLYIAQMSTYPDILATIAVVDRQIWAIGSLRNTEFWTNVGASDFPFQLMPSAVIEYGCCAPYSLAKVAGMLVWLARDFSGSIILLQGSGYSAKRVSNHAVETIWSGYSTASDAVAWSYQQDGHTFYVITFPTANATWVLDIENGLFHRWSTNGGRHRSALGCAAYDMVICQDYETGVLYRLDPNNGTDNGVAIQRGRTFPHTPQNGRRIRYDRFTADMEARGASIPVTLSVSRDRGQTYNSAGTLDLGADGTETQLMWARHGISRDTVFKMDWDSPNFTALNGAYIDVTECVT